MAKKRANGEGSIRKRKDGRWEGRYTAGHDPNTGKTIYKNVLGKTQGEVKEKLKKAIADSQQLDVTRATTYTVKSWIKLWYEVYAEPRLREKKVADGTPPHCGGWAMRPWADFQTSSAP